MDLLQKLDSEALFQSNFLQLNIQFKANQYAIQKDVPAFPLDAFGAQVSGVISLWLNVTIMLIFEMFEFLTNLLYAYYKSKQNQKSDELEIVETKM